MSCVGGISISVPASVDVKIEAGNPATVKDPKGTLTQQPHLTVIIIQEDDVIHVARFNDEKVNRSLHGPTRILLHNMIVGVTGGFKKELDANGVGYCAAKKGNKPVMNLGFSHQVTVEETENITIEMPGASKIVISSTDRQKVGRFAVEVREKCPSEPHKGKDIKYTDEVIRRREGKTGVEKK